MIRFRRIRWFALAMLVLCAGVPLRARAQSESGKAAPSGEAAEGPRSRLTLAGLYEADTYSEKNFFLGARGGAAGKGEYDAFWTQRLNLRPRFIISDDCNLNLSVDLAQGVWGESYEELGPRPTFRAMRVNRAYLALRHAGTRTRWYLGRQDFAFGQALVLDMDAPGLQVYRDLGRTGAIGLGFAKETESGSLGDYKGAGDEPEDGRDADLLFVELKRGDRERGLHLNPFFLWYVDRGNAAGATWLPDGQEPGARFHPNVSSAKVLAMAFSLRGSRLSFEGEFDYLKGTDRVRNANSGTGEALDLNNGDLKGMNGYARLALRGRRLALAFTGARGSGDPDPMSLEGNLNSLRNDGRWALNEIWGNGQALEERGLAPTGLANPYVRGYRGLENTTALQAAVDFRLRSNLVLGGSFTLLRATEVLKGWSDGNADGAISADEYGVDPLAPKGESTELGSEIDWHIDWTVQSRVNLSLRGAAFSPGPAAGYLINGTAKYQESPFLLHLGLSLPIPEFSLGG